MSLMLYHDFFACETDSSAPTLVLLHGWGMHSGVWDSLMPGLLERFSVLQIDLPGMGRSPLPGSDYTLDFLVDQVVEIAPQRAIWLGWSLGGMVAVRLATKYPQRVDKLITLATSPRFTVTENWSYAMPAQALAQFAGWLQEDWEGTLIRFLALQCKDSQTQRDDLRFFKERVFIHGFPAQKALREGLQILADTDLRGELVQIGCPTLHIYGSSDPLLPATLVDAMRSLQPDAQLVCLEQRSHALFVSDPEPVVQLIQGFASAG